VLSEKGKKYTFKELLKYSQEGIRSLKYWDVQFPVSKECIEIIEKDIRNFNTVLTNFGLRDYAGTDDMWFCRNREEYYKIKTIKTVYRIKKEMGKYLDGIEKVKFSVKNSDLIKLVMKLDEEDENKYKGKIYLRCDKWEKCLVLEAIK